MDVFVTGGTGFVGSHVVEQLLEGGHRPLCLVRETSDTTHLDALGVETFVGSLDEVDQMRPAIEQVEAVVHVAGVTKVRTFDEFDRFNGEATERLVELCVDANPDLKRFVFMSSVGAQGPAEGADPRPLDAEPDPVSRYGQSKLYAEQRLLEVSEVLPSSIFRPPPVYGPRDTEMLDVFKAARFGIAPVYGRGEGYLSVIYAADLGRAVVRAIEVDHPSGSVFPIDDGQVHTWRSFTSAVCETMGKTPRHICVPRPLFHAAGHISGWFGRITGQATIFNSDKVAEMSQPSWRCGNEPARRLLNWQPQWSLDDGLERTTQWYREHGWL